ncbi:MAG: glyoxalase [Microthrixaceae bacterium]
MQGKQLDTVVLGDEPRGWAELGFSVSDHPLGAALRLGNTDLVLTDAGGGFEGWSIAGVDDSIAGLPLAAPDSRSEQPSTDHPNGVRGIDHIVFHSGDPDATVAEFESAGIERRGGRSTDSYGAPMRQVFFWLGDVILELIGPDEGEPTTDGPLSFFGLALWSGDLDASVTGLGELAGRPKDAVQPGRRIAGIRGAKVGVSTPLAFMSPHV